MNIFKIFWCFIFVTNKTMKSCFNLANAALIRYLNFLLVFQRKMKQECLGGTEAPISMIFGYFFLIWLQWMA